MARRSETIEILRDTWGVPHIYAETELGALYGQGYVQAEDRLLTLLKAYRKATGRMAEVFGPDWLERDFRQRIWKHGQIALARYGEIDAFAQQAGEAFLAGVKRYMDEHPERVPDWAPDLQPHLPLAAARSADWDFILEQAFSDLHGTWAWNLDRPYADMEGPPAGSNAWAVSAERTTAGHVITLLDPHVDWADEWLFHECHLHGGDLHVYGFQLPGHPYIAIGHNEHLSWTFTAGGPDCADVYELTLNSDNPRQYLYDGTWRDLRSETITVRVRASDGMRSVTREVLYSHHGPIVRTRGLQAYAVKTAYDDCLYEHQEQYRPMNRARSLQEFQDALALRMNAPFNVVYGDVDGNIYYQRAGRVPIRPDGYDWTHPFPGDTSQTEWLGIHEARDLPQMLNPPSGWMQNCNVAPEAMTADNPLAGAEYPSYMLHGFADGRWDRRDGSNSRGRRASELLAATQRMTLDDAISIANDTYCHGERQWREAVLTAYEKRAAAYPHLREAIEVLQAWDGHADPDSVGMTVARTWMWARRDDWPSPLLDAIDRGAALSDEDEEAIVSALDRAAAQLRRWFGTIRVPWGRVCRARRGEESWPVAGVAGCPFVTLRLVNGGREPDETGIYTIQSGQVCPTVVMLKAGDVRSYSAVPFGQSEDPTSPHYIDQGRLLFARQKLKDTWFARDRLEANVASRRTLVAIL